MAPRTIHPNQADDHPSPYTNATREAPGGNHPQKTR